MDISVGDASNVDVHRTCLVKTKDGILTLDDGKVKTRHCESRRVIPGYAEIPVHRCQQLFLLDSNRIGIADLLGISVMMSNLEIEVLRRVEAGEPHLEVGWQVAKTHGEIGAVSVLLATGCCLAVPRPLVDTGAAGDLVLLDRVGIVPVDCRLY